MSVRVMAQVWAGGPRSPSQRLLLLAIADNADDHGLAWPTVQRLSEKVCTDRRRTKRLLRRLEEDGWITTQVGGGSRKVGIPNRYQIDLAKLDTGAPRPPSRPLIRERKVQG